MHHRLADKYHSFLQSIINLNTRSYYKRVLDQFLIYIRNTRKIDFTQVVGADVILWRKDLLATGGVAGSYVNQDPLSFQPNSEVTVENKTDILSSFYTFMNKPDMDGGEPVIKFNPVHSLQNRFNIVGYSNAKKIDRTTFLRLLKQIKTDTVSGKRNLALVWGYFISGRRNSEWLNLKFEDIDWDKTPKIYHYIRKGKQESNDEIPPNLFKYLENYLIARWGPNYKKQPKESYIFASKYNINKCLSSRFVLKLIKTLAFKAGLDSSQICVHSLRHLHAQTYLQNGATIDEIRKRLNHKNLSTTQKYISSLESETDISDQLYKKLRENDNMGEHESE